VLCRQFGQLVILFEKADAVHLAEILRYGRLPLAGGAFKDNEGHSISHELVEEHRGRPDCSAGANCETLSSVRVDLNLKELIISIASRDAMQHTLHPRPSALGTVVLRDVDRHVDVKVEQSILKLNLLEPHFLIAGVLINQIGVDCISSPSEVFPGKLED
jgi:hypothetical protein